MTTYLIQRGLQAVESACLSLCLVCVVSGLVHLVLEHTADAMLAYAPTTIHAAPTPAGYVAPLMAHATFLALTVRDATQILFATTHDLLLHLYRSTLLGAARELYLHGPTFLHHYGFWQGRPVDEICGDLTGVDAAHWRAHPADCERRVDRQVNAYVICVAFVLAVACSYRYVNYLFDRYIAQPRIGAPAKSVS